MVGYANFAGSAYKVANPQYAAQVAKLQQLKSILDGDYKWSHREIKEFLINVIIAFASIEGSAGASSLGIDFNDPSSWEKLNKNNDGNGSNNGNDSGGSGSSGGNVDAITEEKILELLKKYTDQISPSIDVEKIVKTTQEEIINSKLFKDLVSQLIGSGIDRLNSSIAEEEAKRIQADAETLEKTATMLAKEAKDRVDAIAYESQLRANQLEAEARERNQQIFAESRARIEGDEAEVRARNEALDAESKKRQKELQELDTSLKQRIDTVTNEVTNSISTSGQKITELTAKIDSSIESSNQKVSALETKLKKDLATEVETVTNAIKKSAEKSQNDLLAKANELGTDIQTVSEKAKQNASKIETVAAKSDKALTGIEEERRARIAGDNAESLARTTLASTLRNELTAGISEERNTRVSEKEAQATINRNLTSKIGNVENSVTEETKSRIAGDEALGSRITNMSSKVDSSEAKIQTLEQTVATNNTALSKRIDNVNAKIGEVVNGKVTVQVEASIDEFKQSQAEVDRAQTEELNAAKSKIGLNETKITNLQETKASKDEVVSLVRTALTSEWKGEASKAKMEALTEAERIALEKANEAKNAADVAAQAKADAAKAQAIAQSSNDATTKANAAKAQAIADAAAKDAVLKQQAAEDAQRKADRAKNDAIAEARRLNNQTDAKITSLQQTVANNELARAEDAKKITAKFDNLSVGGRNLLIMKRMTTKGYFNPNTGSISGANNDRLDETYYSCEPNEDFIGKLHELNGSYGSSAKIVFYDNEKRFISAHTIHTSTKGSVYKIVSPQNAAFYRVSVIGADVKAMLERGTIPTDWKPAPEDLEANYSNVLAEFNQYKIAQASKNEAFTTELNTAKSKINNAEANITNLQETRASKDEVVSIARRGLESVWQGAANQAKTQAIAEAKAKITEYETTVAKANESLSERIQNAESRIGQSETKITNIENTKATKTEVASIARNALQSEWRGFATAEKENAVVQANRIATEKSNAVKEASETYARAQADLAKANAIAASSNDATTKANAAKAQAIADAAAKDLIVKQQAAEDATAKANAAKNTAIEEARRLNNATNADITLLRKTVSDNTQAIAEDKKELVAKFNNLSVGGRNLIRNSDANTNDNQYLHQFAITEAPAFGEDVIVTLWGDLGTGRDTFGIFNSRGFGELAQLTKISEGVYQSKFKWADNTYTGGNKLSNTSLNVYAYPNTSTSNYTIKKVKFERGTVPTDWTPAPEDDESKYSDVESKITETKSTIATAERALTEKIDQAKSSFNSNLTDIENKQRTLTEKDSAFASQLSSLTTKVNNNESAIRREETARTNNDSSLTTKLNELTAKYNLADAAIKREEKARADADSATTLATRDLTSRLGIAEGKIKTEETTRAEADKSLSSKIESLTSEHKNSKAQLETLKDTYATDKQASASKLSTLESNVRDNKSKLTTLESSLTTKESALSQRIDNLNAEVGKTKASIVSESKARTDEKNAQATVNQTLTNKIGDAEGLIVAERNARTKADESINSNLSGLVGRVGNAEGRITTEERTRIREDNAMSTRITNLNSVLNGAKSDITRLQQTVTTKDGARAQEINTLKASMNDMKIGGRNLVRNSSPYVTDNKYLHLFPITEAPAFGEDVVVTLWGQLGQDRTDFAVYNSEGYGELAKLKKIGDGIYRAKFKWADNTYTGNNKTTNVNLNIYAYPNTASSNNIIRRIKFEKGTIPSDWTPAPEDAESSIDSAKADLREYKNVQATKDNVDTEKLNGALSRIGNAESKISNLETTRANKNEVASLARSTLKAEWDKAVSDAKNALSGEITETRSVATRADNTVNSLYTLKVQADANGKKNIAGLMIGANEAESQVGVVADKFFVASGNFRKTPFVVKENDIFFNGKVYFANEKNLIPNPRFVIAESDVGVVGGVGRPSVTSHVLGGYTTRFLSNKAVNGADWTGVGADGDSESIVKTTFHSTGANRSWWFDTTEFIFDNKDGIPGKRYTFSALANAYRATCSLLVEEMHPVNKQQFVRQLGKSEEIGIGSSKANAPTNGPDFRRGIDSAKNGRRLWCEFTWPSEGAVRISIRGNNINGDRPDIYSARWKLVGGTGEESRKWLADTGTMIDGSTIVSGTINGSHIRAKSIISAPYIIGGSLNIADRFKVMSNGDVLIQAASGNTGMKITSERIDVYDTSGRLRVRMGKLS